MSRFRGAASEDVHHGRGKKKRRRVDLDDGKGVQTSIERPRDGSEPLPWFGRGVGSVPELPAKPPNARK